MNRIMSSVMMLMMDIMIVIILHYIRRKLKVIPWEEITRLLVSHYFQIREVGSNDFII